MANAKQTIALRIRRNDSGWQNSDFYQDEVLNVDIPDPVNESFNILANNKKIWYQSGQKFGQIQVTFRVRTEAVTLGKLRTVRDFLQNSESNTIRILPRYFEDAGDYYVCKMAAGQIPDRLSAHGRDRWNDKITVTFDIADVSGAVFVDEDQIIV